MTKSDRQLFYALAIIFCGLCMDIIQIRSVTMGITGTFDDMKIKELRDLIAKIEAARIKAAGNNKTAHNGQNKIQED